MQDNKKGKISPNMLNDVCREPSPLFTEARWIVHPRSVLQKSIMRNWDGRGSVWERQRILVWYAEEKGMKKLRFVTGRALHVPFNRTTGSAFAGLIMHWRSGQIRCPDVCPSSSRATALRSAAWLENGDRCWMLALLFLCASLRTHGHFEKIKYESQNWRNACWGGCAGI